MGRENRFGMISLFMKVIGSMTEPTVEEDSFMLMEMSTKENGKMIRLMGKECIQTMMAAVILDNGLKTSNMVMEYKNGEMDPHIKGKTVIITD